MGAEVAVGSGVDDGVKVGEVVSAGVGTGVWVEEGLGVKASSGNDRTEGDGLASSKLEAQGKFG